MAKTSNNTIPIGRTDIDWGQDPTNGFPYSGQSVQTFIKSMLNSKATTGSFDKENMILYLFKDEADRDAYEAEPEIKRYLAVGSIPLNFGTTQNRIKITPDNNITTINASLNQESIVLGMNFSVETKEITDPVWVATGQDVQVRVYVDANSTGSYTEVVKLRQKAISLDGRVEIDIKPYIPTGTSRVRIYFYADDDDSISSSVLYTVTLAEMYIEAWEGNLRWNKAIIEDDQTDEYGLGGFRIVGNIAKTIHITLSTASSIVAYYEYDLGITEAIGNAFFFLRSHGLDLLSPKDMEGNALPPLTTGIYTVKAWLTSGTLTTYDSAVTYSIMYVASGERNTAKLVVMNNSGEVVNNYDESAHLCDYAIYNAGQSYGEVTITVTPFEAATPLASDEKTITVETGVIKDLNRSINLERNSNLLSVRYEIVLNGGNSQSATSIVDNTEIFPARGGVSFYLNPSLRSNGEIDTREIIYNTAENKTIAIPNVEWRNMSWVDGLDGWTVDESNRRCLMLPARTKLTIPPSGFRFFEGNNMTIELCFRVTNVSDYNENVITFAENPTENGFMGIRIKPTNITAHSSSDTSSDNDIYQGTNFIDNEIVHLVISIQSPFEGKTGKNLVSGYINGVKAFQFHFEGTSSWSSGAATAIFGSDSADLYLYMMRCYKGTGLSADDVEKNWLNTLFTRNDKVWYKDFVNSVLGSNRQISYEEVKNNERYNFFVVEMTEGAGIPSKTYSSGGKANVEMHYGVDSEGNSRSNWDWKIYDVETKGQGTTSMNYWLWNIRWRIDKTDSSGKRLVAYYDTPTVTGKTRTFNELPAESSKTVKFDGNNHPPVKRITAKINFASSMQSHKMGATKAYELLHDNLDDGIMLNEAQRVVTDEDPMPSVAVYQYPAFGFQKTWIGDQAYYSFIGLFTIGPDKGDKPTFGWNLIDEQDLVSLEGVDHMPQLAKFNIPWDEQVLCTLNEKEDCFLSVKLSAESDEHGFEIGNANGADTKNTTATFAALEQSFKGAYSVIYDNSTLIGVVSLDDPEFGGNSAADVLNNINSNPSSFRARKLNNRISYTDAEFWIQDEYILYHFEQESGTFVSGYKNNGTYNAPLDLRVDTGITSEQLEGLSLDEQNNLFKKARINRFLDNAPTYWDMNELAFNYAFLVIFGATDNFAKNQYPYCMGGKWRFRQDDLDTIMDIDNNGGQTKPADIEFNDSVVGSPYFAGSNSVLWNLVNDSMWSDFTVDGTTYIGIKTMGRKLIQLMVQISEGTHVFDGFVKFFDKCFWSNAQRYFPPSAYNVDANLKYEHAWTDSANWAVDPLQQSLGSHYLAERLWVKRRALYCMSLFGVGEFMNNSDTHLGSIKFRPNQIGSMTVTVAESMYPCLFVGTNLKSGNRTFAGEQYKFEDLNTDGTTVYTLQAMDYITDLGDLCKLKLGPEDNGVFNVSGERLRVLKLGDEDQEKVDNNIDTLNIGNGLPCLEILDLRNSERLSGSLNLSNCKRIRRVYAKGTNLASVVLPRGSKIETLQLPEGITAISYQVIKYLTDLDLPKDPSHITLVYLEECDALNGFETLQTIFNADYQNLQFIRILWNSEIDVTGKQIRALTMIAQNKDKWGQDHTYNDVNISTGAGGSGNPHLEGSVIATKFYGSDITTLANGATPVDSIEHSGMKKIQATHFGPLYITYDPNNEYIDFEDSLVESLVANGFGDSEGLTFAEAATVTSLSSTFTSNTNIESFDELQYFTRLNTLTNAFYGCSNLESVIIPSQLMTIGENAFRGCTALSEITIPSNVTQIGTRAFSGCSSFTNIVIPSGVTEIGEQAFSYCTNLGSVTIPSTVVTIGQDAFLRSCNNYNSNITVLSGATTLLARGFRGCCLDGTLTINSNLRAETGTDTIQAKHLIVNGNLVNAYGTGVIGPGSSIGCECVSVRISGNLSNTGWFSYAGSGNYSKFAFLEVMGNASGGRLCYAIANTCLVNGFIVHLGKNGVASKPNFLFRTVDGTLSSSRFAKIYVGDGSSPESDANVLAAYQADADWQAAGSTYLNLLDTWSNYSGPYKQ